MFIGEILLMVCFLLLALKWRLEKKSLTWAHAGILIYFLWILWKALKGYHDYQNNPLAFRNAALFYYALFALIGYEFWDRKLFGRLVVVWLLAALLIIKFFISINNYFVFPYLILGLILVRRPKNEWLKLVLLALLLYTPAFYFEPKNFLTIDFFFAGGRARVWGHIFAFAVLFFVFLFRFIPWPRLGKIIFFLGFLGLLGAGLARYSDKNALESMLKFRNVIGEFRKYNTVVLSKENGDKPVELTARLYSKEDQGFADNTFLFLKNFNLSHRSRVVERMGDLQNFAIVVEKAKTESMADVIKIIDEQREYLRDELRQHMKVEWEGVNKKIEEEFQELKKMIDQKIKDNDTRTLLLKEVDDRVGGVVKSLENKQQESSGRGMGLMEKRYDNIKEKAADMIRQRKVRQIKGGISNSGLKDEITLNAALGLAEDRDEGGYRTLEAAYNSMLFRLFIWRDMADDLLRTDFPWSMLGGVSFGYPQRSKSLEIIGWARREWSRDGWIAPHNSFLHMIYRGGIVGLICVLGITAGIIFLLKEFIRLKSLTGILLVTTFIYWVTIANFLVFLEVPYNAIPFWALLGMTFAYYKSIYEKSPQSEVL